MAEYDLNAPVQAAQAQKLGNQQLLSDQDAQSGGFLNKYTNFLNSQPTTSALANRIGGELGLPTLRSNAQSLNNTLFNLPGVYNKATLGHDVNANQLSRLIGQKQSEIAPSAALATSNLQSAESNLNTRLGYETADRERALLPFEKEQSFLQDRMARETSLYSQANQSELDAIIAKMQGGITLSEGEKNRAQELAMSEKNYQNQLNLQKNSQSAQGPQTQIVESNGKKVLINSQTGQIISSYAGAPKAAVVTPNPTQYLYGQSKVSTPSYFTPSR